MDKMIIERDVAISSDDIILRADVFRPKDSKPAPVIMTMGPYGKGVEYKTGFALQWKWFTTTHPDVLPGSSRSFMTWETVDPEIWVPWGYAVIRVDSRGAGRSPGYLDVFSERETRDYYNAIEWAGTQEWCNGKVGLNGISYYAINQWAVAALQPPHLAAMIPWEGAADFYRDIARHGGIFSNGFLEAWYPRQVLSIQHGNPSALQDPWLNASASGADPEKPSTMLDPVQLESNRRDVSRAILNHPLEDEFYQGRSPDWSKVTVPFLSAASLAGHGLHPRGNFEAFTNAASKHKWLECHPGRHEEWFYLEQGMDIQKRFLDYFLKGVENEWEKEPPVFLRLRRAFDATNFELRKEQAWPLLDTKWMEMYLSYDDNDTTLLWSTPSTSSSASFEALGKPLTFLSLPFESETEITGPLSAKLFASTSTTDMDLFVTLQAFSPSGKEVDFQGTVDPHTPLAQGWLRASHRKLDKAKTLPYRPYHSHDELLPVEPHEIYELDVEVWPTSVILPAGFRVALQISGKDFEREVVDGGNEAWVSKGSGPFLHNHVEDRPRSVFAGRTTVYMGGDNGSRVLLPIIPAREKDRS